MRKPNKWRQFCELELRKMVSRHYPNFGSDQIIRLDRQDLEELMEAANQRLRSQHRSPDRRGDLSVVLAAFRLLRDSDSTSRPLGPP